MATESTAIHDLLAGLQRKAVPDDPTDDVLFSGSRREDEAGIAARGRHARGTEPPPNLFAMPARPPPELLPSPHLVVSLPRPFQHMPAAGIDPNLQTVRVSKNPVAHWSANKKLYAIPVGLGVLAAILLGIYVGRGNDKPAPVTSAAIVEDEAPPAVEPAPAPAAAASTAVAPVVTPIEEPAQPTVTPIESAPAAAPAAAAAELPRDAVAPPAVVPESAFVAKHEPTVATVTAPAAASPEATAVAEETVAPAPKAKKVKRESARDRRAAKRAAKRTKREGKKVARAERPERDDEEEKPAASNAKLGGNGALSITSAQPREVWVDGRNSKRMTPLRVLLKPGKHKVTLFDKEHGKAKTFEVEIKPNETTKVSK